MMSDESKRQQRIEEVVGSYLSSDTQLDSSDIADFVAQYPDLAPELEDHLKVALAIASYFEEENATVKSYAMGQLRVSCPQCGVHVKVVEDAKESNCHACGSSISHDLERSSTDDDTIGEIGRFKIVSEAGRGAFGIVYQAFDPGLKRVVALKIPHPGQINTRRTKQQFLREARSASALRHPQIVQIHEIGVTPETVFIVSEFIEGRTLSDVCKSQKLPFKRSAEIVEKIANALDYAHEQGVIHRDVKPSNILLDTHGEPFLADFGLARDVEPEFTLTREGEIIGTPAYMSPEQATAEHSQVNATSDVYSTGVVLYRLLTGNLPFQGSRRLLLHQVVNERPRSPSFFDEQIPVDLATITLKAIEKAQVDRYSSAAELASDIRRWLNGDPIRARRPSWFKVFWLRCKKYPVASSLLAGIALLLVAISVGSMIWASNEVGYSEKIQAISESVQSQQIATLNEQGLLVEQNDGMLAALPYFETAAKFEKQLRGNVSELTQLRLDAIHANTPAVAAMSVFDKRIDTFVESKRGIFVAAGSKLYLLSSVDWRILKIFENGYRSNKIALSPDHSTIASTGWTEGGNMSTVRVWDTQSGKLIEELNHDSHIANVTISNDSKTIATSDLNHKIKLWRVSDGSQIAVLRNAEPIIPFVAFSPNDQRLIAVTRGRDLVDSTIVVWNLGEYEIEKLQDVEAAVHAFELDGQKVTVATNTGVVSSWNYTANESKIEILLEAGQRIVGLQTFDDFLLCRFASNQFSIRESGSGKLSEIRGAASGDGFAVSSNGLIQASAAGAKVDTSWLPAGDLLTIPLPHGQLVTALQIIDNRWLMVGGAEGLMKVWDLASTSKTKVLWKDASGNEPTQTFFSDDSQRIGLIYPDRKLELRDPSGNLIGETTVSSRHCLLKFLPNGTGTELLVLQPDGKIRVLNMLGEEVTALSFGNSLVRIDACPQTQTVAIASDTQITLWNWTTRQVVSSFAVHEKPRCLKFDRSGEHLFFSVGKTIYVRDVVAAQNLMGRRINEVWNVRYIEPITSSKLAVKTTRYTSIWQFEGDSQIPGKQAKRVHQFPVHTGAGVESKTKTIPIFSPELKCLITGDANGNVAVREIDDLNQLRCTIEIKGLTNYSVAHQKGFIVCGTQQGVIRSFELGRGQEILPAFKTFRDPSVILSEENNLIICQNESGKLEIKKLTVPNTSFKQQLGRSSYLAGYRYVDGRMERLSSEQQIDEFNRLKPDDQLSPKEIERWNRLLKLKN